MSDSPINRHAASVSSSRSSESKSPEKRLCPATSVAAARLGFNSARQSPPWRPQRLGNLVNLEVVLPHLLIEQRLGVTWPQQRSGVLQMKTHCAVGV